MATPQRPDPSPKKKRRSGTFWLVVLGGGFVLIVMIGALTEKGTGGGSSNKGDASAHFACDHFRDVARDAGNGILTDAELRGKLKEVYSDASVSDVPGLGTAAQQMLADVTSGDVGAFGTSSQNFAGICTSIGH